jgi:hypothetical protein
MLVHALLILLATESSPSGADALARLQARVQVAALGLEPESIAGKYTSASEEVASHWGGGHLSGEDLHLFPDHTYIYCEWADIEPETVYDKGTWSAVGSVVELRSDPEVSWAKSASRKLGRRYLGVRRAGRKQDALLVGLPGALEYFESEAKDDPGFMLLIVGLLRTERYSSSKAARVKSRLMRDAWRPEYFKQGQ